MIYEDHDEESGEKAYYQLIQLVPTSFQNGSHEINSFII